MEQDPNQPIVGRFSLWVSDISPGISYWRLLLLDYGIYDSENDKIEKLLKKHKKPKSLTALTNPLSEIIPTHSRSDVTLDFFLWLYTEDKQLCFEIMKHIYEDFKDDEDAPDPYHYVDELEDYEPGGRYPDVDIDDIVHATPQVVGDDAEFEFYQRLHPHFETATEEAFIVDSYVNEELFELYLAETDPDVEKRILTKQPQGNFDAVAEKFVKNNNQRVEVREHPECHDRLLFVDDQCFAVGISIKDAGRKPTYLVEFDSGEKFRKPWEKLWEDAEQYKVFE
ncbi:hypothetical protein [Halovenus sp. HT40]|uniref:hypothetical protein n=1 Tax=Halovenus sp. HT40 TaxID=3126691 RepID=UPI00300F0EBD